jgi:hypothetical protein
MLFSVGATGGADGDVVVVVVVVVEVSGAFFSSLAQAAMIVPIAMMAPMPATAESRRGKWLCDVISSPYLCLTTIRGQRSADHTQS